MTGKTVIRKESDFFYAVSLFFELFFRRTTTLGGRTLFSFPFWGAQGIFFPIPKFFLGYPCYYNFYRADCEGNLFKLDNLTAASKFLVLGTSRFKGLSIYS